MAKLLAYSGLTTKVRAMEKNLLNEEDYSQIINLNSVTEVVSYLEKHRGYAELFKGINIYELHRGELEKFLHLSSYRDFSKLYNFASVNQRKYLELYFMKHETHLLKQLLREILNKNCISSDISAVKPYFDKFSKINLSLLSEAKSVDNFITSLKGTIYYEPLIRVQEIPNTLLYDYELCLDLQYFETMWGSRKKYLSGVDYEVITQSYGYKLDLLNLQWIYRCKKYYKISNADIYAMLIPIYYKFKKSQIKEMVEAETINGMLQEFSKTYYYKKAKSLALEDGSHEKLYRILMDKHHNKSFKANPYSLACIDTYLYRKQQEISKLISLIECIRYSYSSDKINNLLNNGGERID